ncbi:Gfo/Idh/MocA family oxidoreductase [Bradyrhizobium liaoningense]|uniref:Gfo/Idh/MocA family protein n=1 Tax=Bradyrhizobium liaoningense TaxID=43992 RepID=UPI001BAB7268|nr:Gfo/Idh/MocA family oxidoreductase [Bradyrhizobium liaoningense]MBR0838849.1 Gfo/Idh/MocA family oxidoreductase [Bradyrhizobium liaoningense]
MTHNVVFIGRGWVVTDIWLPNLQRAGISRFCCIDPFAADPAECSAPFRTVRNLDELQLHDVDVAIVASPNAKHAEHARAFLGKGVSTIIEKPVCFSSDEALRLGATSAASSAQLLRSCASTFDPHFEEFRRLVDGHGTARIQSVTAHWIRGNGIPSSRWLTEAQHAVAGSSLDLGWHLLECILALLDYPKMKLTNARFSFLESADGAPGRFASWYGSQSAHSLALVDVDIAAELKFRTVTGTDVAMKTAWQANVAHDEVRLSVAGQGFELDLSTIFGMSRNGPARPHIYGIVDGKALEFELPKKKPGEAHTRMIQAFVDAGFDSGCVKQDIRQLDALASASAQIVDHHRIWRARVS